MISLDIKVKNGYSNYLNKILNGVNLFNYVWEINADNFLYFDNGELKEDFFGADVLNAEEFIKCISRDSYYMIFADIKVYSLGSERIEIKTFKDFLRSSCVMIILCTDSSVVADAFTASEGWGAISVDLGIGVITEGAKWRVTEMIEKFYWNFIRRDER